MDPSPTTLPEQCSINACWQPDTCCRGQWYLHCRSGVRCVASLLERIGACLTPSTKRHGEPQRQRSERQVPLRQQREQAQRSHEQKKQKKKQRGFAHAPAPVPIPTCSRPHQARLAGVREGGRHGRESAPSPTRSEAARAQAMAEATTDEKDVSKGSPLGPKQGQAGARTQYQTSTHLPRPNLSREFCSGPARPSTTRPVE